MAYLSATGDPGPKRLIDLIPLKKSEFKDWRQTLPDNDLQWLDAAGFTAKPGQFYTIPANGVDTPSCIFGMRDEHWLTQRASLALKLPEGV